MVWTNLIALAGLLCEVLQTMRQHGVGPGRPFGEFAPVLPTGPVQGMVAAVKRNKNRSTIASERTDVGTKNCSRREIDGEIEGFEGLSHRNQA